eukprot:4118002-Amphidinium_carterae.1
MSTTSRCIHTLLQPYNMQSQHSLPIVVVGAVPVMWLFNSVASAVVSDLAIAVAAVVVDDYSDYYISRSSRLRLIVAQSAQAHKAAKDTPAEGGTMVP